MLRKLTSPKAKEARGVGDGTLVTATGDAELSALATASGDSSAKSKDDDRGSNRAKKSNAGSANGGNDDPKSTVSSRVNRASRASRSSAKAPAERETSKPVVKKRDDLSLNMRAVAEAAAKDEEEDGTGEAAVDGEPRLSGRDGSPDRAKTFVRSPRVRKDLLGSADEKKSEDSAETPSAGKTDASDTGASTKKTPSKRPSFAGLRALKPRSNAKPTTTSEHKPSAAPAGDTAAGSKSVTATASSASGERDASDDTHESDDTTSRDRGHKASRSSKDKRVQGLSKPSNSDAKSKKTMRADRLDERDEDGKDHDPSAEVESAPTQPTKSVLSPLRRRAPAQVPASTDAASLTKKLGQRLQLRDLPPANQPEVHITGEITTGEGFTNGGGGGFACKWGVEVGGAWHHIAGDQLGQTQIDYPSAERIVWSHPVELHFATSSFHGWPKLLLQVWRFDAHMTASVVGYGFVNVPFAPGEHCVSVSLWRPMGSSKQELAAKLLGRTPELVTDDVVFSSAWADRCRLQTIATGSVQLQLGVMLRNFDTSSLAM